MVDVENSHREVGVYVIILEVVAHAGEEDLKLHIRPPESILLLRTRERGKAHAREPGHDVLPVPDPELLVLLVPGPLARRPPLLLDLDVDEAGFGKLRLVVERRVEGSPVPGEALLEEKGPTICRSVRGEGGIVTVEWVDGILHLDVAARVEIPSFQSQRCSPIQKRDVGRDDDTHSSV